MFKKQSPQPQASMEKLKIVRRIDFKILHRKSEILRQVKHFVNFLKIFEQKLRLFCKLGTNFGTDGLIHLK